MFDLDGNILHHPGGLIPLEWRRTVALSVPPPGLSNIRSVPGTRTDTCPNIPIVPCKLSIRVKVAVLRRNNVSSVMNAASPSGAIV